MTFGQPITLRVVRSGVAQELPWYTEWLDVAANALGVRGWNASQSTFEIPLRQFLNRRLP